MAQSIRRGSSKPHSGTQSVAARPHLAARIGSICGAWAVVEAKLIFLYGLLLGSRYVNQTDAPIFDPLAFQVFDTLETSRLRIALLTKISSVQLKEFPDLISRLDNEVFAAVRSAAKLRNKIVHAQWGISDTYPNSLILIKPEKWLVYNESDFKEAFDRIESAVIIISKFSSDIAPLLHRK